MVRFWSAQPSSRLAERAVVGDLRSRRRGRRAARCWPKSERETEQVLRGVARGVAAALARYPLCKYAEELREAGRRAARCWHVGRRERDRTGTPRPSSLSLRAVRGYRASGAATAPAPLIVFCSWLIEPMSSQSANSHRAVSRKLRSGCVEEYTRRAAIRCGSCVASCVALRSAAVVTEGFRSTAGSSPRRMYDSKRGVPSEAAPQLLHHRHGGDAPSSLSVLSLDCE